MKAPLRAALLVAAVTIVYFVAGKVGLRLAFVNASATAVWPATGIALAALLVLGPRVWPGILLGAFLVNVTTSGNIATSLGIAAGNCAEGVLGAWLVRRFAGGARAFERPRDIFKFVLFAGLACTAVSATFGVTTLSAAGLAPWRNYGAIWMTWWLGDAGGALVVAPCLVLWGAAQAPRLTPRRLVEASVLLPVLLLVALFVFGGNAPLHEKNYPLEFLCIPVLLWAAFRFTPRETATAVLLLSAVAVVGTLRGFGPFARNGANESLLILQAFMAVISVTTLLVAATATERKRIAASLRELNEQLEARVVERTHQLSVSNRRLRLKARQRASSETRLRESEARLHEAQRVARVGSWEWDIEANSVWWSPELYALYGLDETTFGASYEAYLERLHPDDRDRIHAAVQEAFRTTQPFSFDHRVVRPDGEILTLHANGRVIVEGGRPIRMVGTGQDITERREAEEQRARLIEERAARREAEEANRLKDEFLAMLSHELRTPLNSIAGWAELLRIGRLDAATTERAIDTIRRNVQSQNQLVSDLLDISRLTSRRVELKRDPVSLPTVVDRAIDTMRPGAQSKGVALHADVDRSLPAIVGDAVRLEQVAWNLLSNAVKFTPEGGRVSVTLARDGDAARLCIEDTGAGIDPAFMPYVFDAYRQGRSPGAHRSAGMGLGLAIVKRLVESHGGTIEAANRVDPQTGAVFTVTLPLRAVQVSDFVVETPSPPLRRSLSGVRILLVEDEANSREPITLLLAGRGADVRAVASSIEALCAFEADCPDILISDIEMPGENGYDLIRRVRSLPGGRGSDIPAIALTAYAGADNEDRALRSGFQAHVSKPIQFEALVDTVAELIRSTPPATRNGA